MAVMNMPNSKSDLLTEVKHRFKALRFEGATTFYWSPKRQTIFYNATKLDTLRGQWALMHEVAHALLGHTDYQSDVNLVRYEVEAWQKADELTAEFKIPVDVEHVEDCLDTYRDWLYARSTCPTCSLNALQTNSTTYRCLNCYTTWRVSPSRFCRPYRMQGRHKKTPLEVNQVVFL
jgi:hypothetical protein